MNLYNKYRPATFAGIAQPHIARVLQAQLATGEHASTYLFSGPSGTGKTTTARVMAMALQCEKRGKGGIEPCRECESCRLTRADKNRDVVEINCATHNGVDDARAMIAERMRIAPSRGDYRIFILDEAHQLTSQAQNALLKVLEEPPSYVRFFLCTTEPQKILTTIKGRCQPHVLTKVSDQDTRAILEKVVQAEVIEAESTALDLIVQTAAGNVRNALVLLEQVSQIGATEENVRTVLGRAPKALAIDLIVAIRKADRALVFQILDTAQAEGRDLGALLDDASRELLALIRKKLLSAKTPEETQAAQKASAQMIELATRLIEITIRIRQNVPADLAVPVGIMKTIDWFATP